MKKIRKSKGDIFIDIWIYLVSIVLIIVTVYPFLNVIALSFNDYIDTVKGGIYIFPRKFTVQNYIYVLQNKFLLTGLYNSVLRTVCGTCLSLICSTMLAYTLSRTDFLARKVFSVLVIITMYISGGLIPDYLLIMKLKMVNSFSVYLLPMLLSAWNVFILRSYMSGLPFELQEAAIVDGANDLVIFFKVILPLCGPVLATIGLYCAVGQWNAWYDTYMYNFSDRSLTTLQYELMKILRESQADSIMEDVLAGSESAQRVSPESIKMAITVIVTIPIITVYPFIQKFFVKGVTLGAVKV